MTDAWHRPLAHIRGDELTTDTGQTSGMKRWEAVSGKRVGSDKLWMGRTHVAPGSSSGNHHHGDTETAIYVVEGHPVFVFADEQTGAEVRLETAPGDFIFVPPHTPHREENPTGAEAVVVIARSSQEAVVVNVESLG